MKRCAGLLTVIVPVVFSLVIVGCSGKQESPAPSAKPSAKGVNMQEGQWEITTTFEMTGVPGGTMKPQTFTTCLSQKDYVPKGGEQTDCSLQDSKVDGDTVTWSLVCKDSTAKGKVTYAGSTFDGVMETTMKEGGKDMTATMTMKGRHLGPCPK